MNVYVCVSKFTAMSLLMSPQCPFLSSLPLPFPPQAFLCFLSFSLALSFLSPPLILSQPLFLFLYLSFPSHLFSIFLLISIFHFCPFRLEDFFFHITFAILSLNLSVLVIYFFPQHNSVLSFIPSFLSPSLHF